MATADTTIYDFIVQKMREELISLKNDYVVPEVWITSQNENIQHAARRMYFDYMQDNELDDLYHNYQNDWFKEYLYEYVDTSQLVYI